jgi:modification methylase
MTRNRQSQSGVCISGSPLRVAPDSKKRHGALVRADGAIMLGDKVGSIHRSGARLRGLQRLDHIETNKGLKLIDELRAEIRSGMAPG